MQDASIEIHFLLFIPHTEINWFDLDISTCSSQFSITATPWKKKIKKSDREMALSGLHPCQDTPCRAVNSAGYGSY